MSLDARKRPVSSHWLFVPAVALWFAALFGAGLYLMPAEVLGQIATRTQLASALPLAAPPVSLAGRAAISGIATMVGLLFGLVLARRIARANRPVLDDDEIAEPSFLGLEDDEEDEQDRVWIDEETETLVVPSVQVLRDTPRVFNPREDIGEEGIAYGGAEFATHVEVAMAEPETAPPVPPEPEPASQPIGDCPVPEAPTTASLVIPEDLADLPLSALNERLAQAFARHRERLAGPIPARPNDSPGTRFQHESEGFEPPEGAPADPQESLRSALEKLTRTGNPH